MEVFTHDVKKVKGTANKNGLKNATCKQSLKPRIAIFYVRYFKPYDSPCGCLKLIHTGRKRKTKSLVLWTFLFATAHIRRMREDNSFSLLDCPQEGTPPPGQSTYLPQARSGLGGGGTSRYLTPSQVRTGRRGYLKVPNLPPGHDWEEGVPQSTYPPPPAKVLTPRSGQGGGICTPRYLPPRQGKSPPPSQGLPTWRVVCLLRSCSLLFA